MVSDLFTLAEGIVGERPDAIGISCGGPLDAARGVVLSPPNLPTWRNVPVVALAEARFGVPAHLENDANASALAEWRFGAGRGYQDLVFLTFGTGLGAGLILDGHLYRGTNGNAGEVGHIRLCENGPIGFGKCGSFEGFCSGGGIARLAWQMAKEAPRRPSFIKADMRQEELTTKDIAEAARRGDPVACEVFRIAGERLGAGLAILVDVLNPEVIVMGGVFMRCGDLLLPPCERVLHREALSESLDLCRILPAALGEEIGDYAALGAALL
jgi:glucokinase